MKNALLIIDVQQGLFDDAPRPFEADAVLARINALSARARAAGCPVVWVQHERADGFLAYASDSWQLQSDLMTEPADIRLRKTTPDSFLHTPLLDSLTQRGIEQVVICGYACEFCVDTTTRRAAALGFAVVLAADAHTTHDKDHASAAQIRTHHNSTLPNISSFGPVIEAVMSPDVVFNA
jgi:nicotinamidase-related amidase